MITHPTHRPLHLIIDGGTYFVTSSTVERERVFKDDEHKELLKRALFKAANKNDVKLIAWILMDDHYHMEFQIENASDISRFIGNLHGYSSKLVNELDGTKGRRVWFQYWDSQIRGESDLWKRFNYIHQNPVKHGYCKDIWGYSFSSCHNYDRILIEDCLRDYPIIDFIVDSDD